MPARHPPRPTTCARSSRALVDGSRVPRVQGALRQDAGLRLRAHLTATRSASSPTTASCSPSRRSRARTSSSCATSAACRWCSCRTSPASWSAGNTRTAASPRTAPRWSTRWPAPHGAQVHRDHRRLLRRRQLRHVRPRLRRALPVDVAQRAHLGDGRRAGGRGAGHRQARRARGARRDLAPRRGGAAFERRSASSTRPRATRTTPPPGCGTTASSTRWTRAACWRWRSRPAPTAAAARAPLRHVPDVTRRPAHGPAHGVFHVI